MKFIPNPAAIPYLTAGGAGVLEGLEDKAEQAADASRSIAPVGETGEYRDSIEAEGVVEGGIARGRVSADVPYANIIEFGSEDTETFAPLRRGLDSVK